MFRMLLTPVAFQTLDPTKRHQIWWHYRIPGLLFLASTLLAAVLLSGCASTDAEWEQQKNDIALLQSELDNARAHIAQLEADRKTTEQELASAQADLKLKVATGQITAIEKEEAERHIAVLTAKLANTQEVIAKVNKATQEGALVLDGILEAARNAPTPEEGWADAIKTGGTAVAPLAGPYAPFVLLGTALTSGVLASIGQRKRTARKIVAPLEAARLPALEQALAALTNHPVLVIDKTQVALGHAKEGMAPTIQHAASTVSKGALESDSNILATSASTIAAGAADKLTKPAAVGSTEGA